MSTLMLSNNSAKGQMLASEALLGRKASTLGVSETVSEKKGFALDPSPGTDNEFSGTEGKQEDELVPKSKSKTPAMSDSVSGIEAGSGFLVEHNSINLDHIAKANRTETRNDKFRRRSKTPVEFRPLVSESDMIGFKNGVETREPLEQYHKAHEQQKGDDRNQLPRVSSKNIPSAQYPDEGPSNYSWNRKYQGRDSERNRRWNANGATRVGYLEQDRADILRMLDELRDQVQRSCEVTDKQKPSAPADKTLNFSSSYVHEDRTNWAPESSSSLDWNPSHRATLFNEHNMSMLNFYPTVPPQNDIPGYVDSLIYRRAPRNVRDYTQQHADSYLYGQLDPDPGLPYHHEGFYHQPSCTCIQCSPRPFSVPEQGPPSMFSHRRIPYFSNNHELYPISDPPIFGARSSNKRGGNALRSVNSSTERRTMISMSDRRPCRPVAGAAPFVTCYNCFELLQLPESTSLKKHFRLLCGSCSNINTVQCHGNNLAVSANPRTSHSSSGKYSNSCNSPNDGVVSTDEKLVLPYIFPVHDTDKKEKAHGLDFSGPEKVQGLSTSSSMSGHMESPESGISHKDVHASSEIPLEAQVVSRLPSLLIHNHFGYSLSDQLIDGSGNGSRSKLSDEERNVSLSGKFKQKSSKDTQVATEMDLPTDEYPPHGLSQDSWDMIKKDEAQEKIIKPGESFLSGLVKKSFRFNQSSRHGRSKVSINGHHVPDRLVKKAEKLAGPVFPGEYWYDYRAGFWGVMGHPCLGIIPPYIEEFNHPMPKNCAGGTTGVLVNGRELHQKDLNLLYRRGLPDTRGSYIIDISGRVWDEDSGEELDCLGRLAPTVEKVQHGFGMRVPRDLANYADTN